MAGKIVDALLWAGYPIVLATLCLVIYRRSYRVLTLFTIYLGVSFFNSTSWLYISSNEAMFRSMWAYYWFWIGECVVSLLRLLAIAEICWRTLKAYAAVWHLVSRTLLTVAAALLVWTFVSANASRFSPQRFFDIGLQRFEFMQGVLLIAFFLMVMRYGIPLLPLHRLILFGLCFYSTIQVANNELNWLEPARLLPLFSAVRRVSITISASIWLYAAARQFETKAKGPEANFPPDVGELGPRVHDRLRDLNDKLGDLLHA